MKPIAGTLGSLGTRFSLRLLLAVLVLDDLGLHGLRQGVRVFERYDLKHLVLARGVDHRHRRVALNRHGLDARLAVTRFHFRHLHHRGHHLHGAVALDISHHCLVHAGRHRHSYDT
jgi:hypothetical protein